MTNFNVMNYSFQQAKVKCKSIYDNGLNIKFKIIHDNRQMVIFRITYNNRQKSRFETVDEKPMFFTGYKICHFCVFSLCPYCSKSKKERDG